MLEFLRNLNPNNRTTATNRRNDAPTVPTVTIEVSPPAEEEDRAQWKSPVQFFMTILGFCVGLGNIWRFPYLCQKNGGGAFVIPFVIMLVLEGMPLLLLELGIGQKMRTGSFGVWNKVHPWLGGIGLGSTVVAVIVGCYYNSIIAWCIFYLFKSFNTVLPWAECPTIVNGNLTTIVPECEMSSETSYFWYRQALDISPSIDDFDGIRWWMLISLAIAWIVVYLIIMKGIQSSGYVVYFTAMFPYIVLTIFLIRGLTLPGASAGLMHMFYPKIDKLMDPGVWLDAANQVFFSYGLAFGSIISFGSYNTPTTNCVRDVYVLTLCNVFTAIYACAVIFGILGFKAQHLFDKCLNRDLTLILAHTDVWHGKGIHDITADEYTGLMNSHVINLNDTLMNQVFTGDNTLKNCSLVEYLNDAAEGTGLAFIVMADVFTKLPGAPFWSILFFTMLLSLGLGSQIGILEGMIATLFDIPAFKSIPKPILTGVACLGCFLIGLVFVTGAGEYWLALFDKYGAMGLTLIALIEIVATMYVYGHAKFTKDVQQMTGYTLGPYWQIMWRFVSIFMLAGLLIISTVQQFGEHPTYAAWDRSIGKAVHKPFPSWTLAIGGCLAMASILPIVVVFILRITGLSSPHVDYEPGSPMKRVETNASTHPMMGFSDLNEDDEQKSEDNSSDSEDAIAVDKNGPTIGDLVNTSS